MSQEFSQGLQLPVCIVNLIQITTYMQAATYTCLQVCKQIRKLVRVCKYLCIVLSSVHNRIMHTKNEDFN